MAGPFGRVLRDEIPEVRKSTTFYKLPRPSIVLLLVLMICLETIILKTLKTAGANPADALRYE